MIIHTIIIIQAAALDAARQLAVDISGNEADRQTFDAKLSIDGSEPPTHYACGVRLRTPDDTQYTGAFFAANQETRWWSRVDDGSELLIAAWDDRRPGGVFTFHDALTEVGLVRIAAEDV